MKWYGIFLAAGLVMAPATASAVLPYYVSTFGYTQSQAGDPIAAIGDTHSYNTGSLLQTQVDGTALSGVQSTYDTGPFIEITSASGSVDTKVEIGALHAYSKAQCDTGLLNPPSPFAVPGVAQCGSSTDSYWSETVHLLSMNPNGSDFTFTLGLEDAVSAGGIFYPLESGFYAASASSSIAFTNTNLGVLDPLLVEDRRTIYSSGQVIEVTPTQRTTSLTVHIVYGSDYFATITGRLITGASAVNGTGLASVDASHTSLFAMYSPDPLASYSTASGTVFATAVPEPTTCAAFVVGGFAWAFRRRRR